MATFEITGPDGKKYRVTGESPEGAMSALKKSIGSNAGAGGSSPGATMDAQPPVGGRLSDDDRRSPLPDDLIDEGKRIIDGDPEPRRGFMAGVDTVVRGAADIFSLGAADEIAAGADAVLNPVFGTGEDGGSLSERYDKNLATQRGTDAADSEERGALRLGGQVAGGVVGGLGLVKAGLSLGANAAGQGLEGSIARRCR
jgi:hypothetical protein